MKIEIFLMALDAHKGEGIPLIYGFSTFLFNYDLEK
jgi:hypothetical protein